MNPLLQTHKKVTRRYVTVGGAVAGFVLVPESVILR